MNTKLIKSKELYTKAVKLIPGGVNSPVRAFKQVGGAPFFVEKAAGSRISDVDGKEYIDFCQSWGPLILGHSHPAVIHNIMDKLPNGLSYGACHQGEIELAELILEAFNEFDQVRMVNSGTEAVMTALRLARGYTQKPYVIKFEGCYHGHFDGMLVKAGSGLATHGIASSSGVPTALTDSTLVATLDNEESVETLFKKHPDQIAAIIIEPLPANNGLLIQRKEFLEYLRGISEKHNALLIFDEVITGFRFHYGGYYQELNIQPDILTLGKIIGGGMPVGAIVSTQAIMNHLSPQGNVYQAGTLSGNPIALAAGIATLKQLKKDNPYNYLDQLGNRFAEIFSKSKIPIARVIQKGSILWLYLDEGELPKQPDKISPNAVRNFNSVYGSLLEKGFYLPPSSYEVLFLSQAHTLGEVDSLAQTILELISTK